MNKRIMTTFPNQKIISINKEPANRDNLYFIANYEATKNAMKELRHGSLKLWLYLNMNQPGYEMALSPADVEYKTGLSPASYSRAVEELTKKLYLVNRESGSNLYDFCEANKPYQNDNNQNDNNQNDMDMPYQNKLQSNEFDETPNHNDIHPYQNDRRNITENTNKTDNINNYTIRDVVDSKDFSLNINGKTNDQGLDNLSYTNNIHEIFELYEMDHKFYKTSMEHFFDTIKENNIKCDDIPYMSRMWLEWFEVLENERSEKIKVPYRYDLLKVCNMFLDLLANNVIEDQQAEIEMKRLKKEEAKKEEKRKLWEKTCNETVEELKDFADVFNTYRMSKEDITFIADDLKYYLKNDNIEKSQWIEFATYWLNKYLSKDENDYKDMYIFKRSLEWVFQSFRYRFEEGAPY